MSSNVPLARIFLRTALKECDMDEAARRYCKRALRLMTRASAVRRAPRTGVRITPGMKVAVRRLKNTDLTMHQIANRVGLPNGGRVSEIMGRKR